MRLRLDPDLSLAQMFLRGVWLAAVLGALLLAVLRIWPIRSATPSAEIESWYASGAQRGGWS